MGQFSWKTGDTKRSIHSNGSCECGFPVAMILPDNSRYLERAYEGYGVFGGKDIYELIAELNGRKGRDEGLDIDFSGFFNGGFKLAAKKGFKIPKLAENIYAKYDEVDYPTNCPDQGWVCDMEDEEDEEE